MTSPNVAIVTDSTADLPPNLVKGRAITVVPVTLHFEGRSLLDGVDIRPSELYRKLANATTDAATSQPEPRAVPQAYGQLLTDHEHVVSIHLSELFGGTDASRLHGAETTD